MTTNRAIPVYKVILQWTRKATGYIGKLYEMTIDPDNKRLYVHDNSTAGGNPVHIHVNNVDELSTVLEDYYTESEINSLLSDYEPAITKGTTDQYFRGDMSLATFPTTMPPTIHDHDDRYLTDSEITTLLMNYAGISHDHAGVYEPVIADKNTAFNVNFGTTSGTACEGNDARLSNARTPTAHTHNYGFLVKLNDESGFIVTTDGLNGASINFMQGESMSIRIAANRTLIFSATNAHSHDDQYHTQNEIAGFFETVQPIIRACTDAEAENGEIFISTSVSHLRLSHKDTVGNVTRTT